MTYIDLLNRLFLLYSFKKSIKNWVIVIIYFIKILKYFDKNKKLIFSSFTFELY